MPRQARKRAESGIYHTMLRGIDRQQIFEDSEDCIRFMDIVEECREICGFKLGGRGVGSLVTFSGVILSDRRESKDP